MIDASSLLRLLLACTVVAAVLVAINVVLRAATRGRGTLRAGGRLLAVLETTALPGAATMHAVRVGDRYFAIVRSGTQVATVCEIAPDAIARSG